MEHLSPEYWQSKGGVKGYEGRYPELNEDLMNGDVIFKAVGENLYRMYSSAVGVSLGDLKGKPFVFSFDQNNQTREAKPGLNIREYRSPSYGY